MRNVMPVPIVSLLPAPWVSIMTRFGGRRSSRFAMKQLATNDRDVVAKLPCIPPWLGRVGGWDLPT